MVMDNETNEVKHSLKINSFLNIVKQCTNIVFPLITYPYVARVLGAENLGKYSFADSIVGYFGLFATLGIPTYAVREGARIRNDKKKINSFAAELFTINICAMVISSCILYITMVAVPRFHENAILMYILSINIFTGVLGRDWINSIYEDFLYITLRYIIFQVIALALIFAFIKNQGDYIKYTIIMLIANSGGYITNFFYTQKYVPVKITHRLNLKKHLGPIFYLFCTSVAVTIYIKSDITILGFLCSDEEVGIYTLSSKIYTIIKALLNAIIMVAIPRLSSCLGKNDIEKYNMLLGRLKRALCTIVFPAVIGLFMMSKNVMILVGGKAYSSGHIALSTLCFALVFAVFGCFYAQGVLVVNRKEKFFLYATLMSAIVNLGLNIVVIPYIGIEGAAITTVIAECMVVLICRHYSKTNIKLEADGDMKSVVVGCVSIVLICTVVKMKIKQMIIQLIIAIFLSCIAYVSILILYRNKIALEMLSCRIKDNRQER